MVKAMLPGAQILNFINCETLENYLNSLPFSFLAEKNCGGKQKTGNYYMGTVEKTKRVLYMCKGFRTLIITSKRYLL